MKNIIKHIPISKESIKATLTIILSLTGFFYGIYILGQHRPLILGLVVLCPLITYLWIDDETEEKNKKGIGTLTMIFVVLFAICIGSQHGRYEVMIAKQFMQGRSHTYTVDTEDEDGRPGTEERQQFIPSDESDNYKVETIDWLLWLTIIGSPVSTWYILKKYNAVEYS